MSKIICIGSSAQDIFFPTDGGAVTETPEDLLSQKKISFELGAKYSIDDRFESLGGCAVNAACGLARLGENSVCYTLLGNDMVGEWIRKEIKKEKVDDSLIETAECFSGLSAIVVDEKSGERIIFSNQEANERMKISIDKISEVNWIFITDLSGDWKKITDDVLEAACKIRAKVAFNPRGKNISDDPRKVYELAGKTEIFFVNKDEAIEIVKSVGGGESDLNNEVELLKSLKESGAKIVVITDGPRGAWVSDGENAFFAEGIKVKAKDTTGAGDAFSSGFLAACVKEKGLEEALKWGTSNGASVVKFFGGVEGLLRLEEIKEKAKNIEAKKIG